MALRPFPINNNNKKFVNRGSFFVVVYWVAHKVGNNWINFTFDERRRKENRKYIPPYDYYRTKGDKQMIRHDWAFEKFVKKGKLQGEMFYGYTIVANYDGFEVPVMKFTREHPNGLPLANVTFKLGSTENDIIVDTVKPIAELVPVTAIMQPELG